MMEVQSLTILGAGSWGTTLSWLLASHGKQVTLWTREKAKAERLDSQRQLEKPMLIKIPQSVKVSFDLDRSIEESDALVFCCTSQGLRNLAECVSRSITRVKEPNKIILVSAVKGLELMSLKRMSQILLEIMPKVSVCALSGPNLASEILQGLPALAVIASKSPKAAQAMQKALSVPGFRLYSNDDIKGVELGGTLKNVIAIAAGASDGLKLGSNAKAALLTRGLAEMTRLAVHLGAKASTLAGLAGMGDLFATASGPQSRNYRLGLELAQGRNMSDILDDIGAVIEGISTTQAVCELSRKFGLELPIAQQVNQTLKGNTTPKGAIMALMGRPLSSE